MKIYISPAQALLYHIFPFVAVISKVHLVLAELMMDYFTSMREPIGKTIGSSASPLRSRRVPPYLHGKRLECGDADGLALTEPLGPRQADGETAHVQYPADSDDLSDQ